jgi:hypothetical protein
VIFWILFSITGPSRHCSTIPTTWSNCEPYLLISSNTLQNSSCTGCIFYVTSIIFPWREVICCCMVHCSWDIFIISTVVTSFINACKKNSCCCTSYSCASIILSYRSSLRHSYVYALLSLSCFYSDERDLILTILFLAVSSLWSHTSCRVLDTSWAYNFVILA